MTGICVRQGVKMDLGLCALMSWMSAVCVAQKTMPTSAPSKAELAAITERGKALAEYNAAAWHATDAVVALKPDRSVMGKYIARKNGKTWIVAFGRLNPGKDKFLISYEATQKPGTDEYAVQKFAEPKADTMVYLPGIKAMNL